MAILWRHTSAKVKAVNLLLILESSLYSACVGCLVDKSAMRKW